EGVYYFDVVVVDGAGNRSATPTGNGKASTVYDTHVPTLGSITVPAYTNTNPVRIDYGAATDNLSGVALYKMYYKQGGGGTWTDVGVNLVSTGGSVDFTIPGSVQGTYYLGLRAADAAGNDTGVPTGNGSVSFMFDVTRPLNLTNVTISPTVANVSSLPIQVSYVGAADADSGLKEVQLWYRKELVGIWTNTGLPPLTTENGSFSFTPSVGEGTYYLMVVPEDKAGNTRYISGNGDGTFVYDNTPPAVGTVNAPDYASGGGISVGYTAASDEGGSGVSSYRLWYKYGDSGTWTEYTTTPLVAGGGNVTFVPQSGNGRYYFGLRACDLAGNCSVEPTGSGQDSTLFDTVAPTNGTATSPQYSRWPVVVSYSGASDELSGIDFVRLYYKKGSGSWIASTLTSSGESGSFNYTGSGDGTYYFAVVAKDKAGNSGASPSDTSPGATTLVDTVMPTVGSISVAGMTRTVPISVAYSGCSDNVGGSGLSTVKLWYKKGEGGVWTDSGLSSAVGSGTFNFTGVTTDDRYYFGLQVIDKAGNDTGAPTGVGLGSVLVDRVAPTVGTIAVDSPTNTVPIEVNYSGCSDGGSGIDVVKLWYKYGDSGLWTDSSLSSAAGSGVFNFSDVSADGMYYFGLQVKDKVGNDTGVPTGNGLASVFVDRGAPVVTVEMQTVTDRNPELRGTVEDISEIVEMKVRVGGHEYSAVIVGNVWTVQVTSSLRRGVYDVEAEATDALGQVGVDTTTDELFVDVPDPWVTVDRLVTNDVTPVLTGSMGPATEDLEVVRVSVSVGGYSNTAELDVSLGVWSMEVLEPLSEGVYDVVAEVEDSGNNISWDTTDDELEVDLSPPEIEVVGPEPPETTGEPVLYHVFYRGVKEVSLTANDIELLTQGGDVSATVTVERISKSSDIDMEYQITLSEFEGNGEVALHILAGTAVDEAGNDAPDYIGGYTLHVETEAGLPVIGDIGIALMFMLLLGLGVFGIHYRYHRERENS
ncbi:MAG TPA: Ig-like domain repeat protein, partial [Candidatus Hydrogenedens sp.]|nr:Ig-like domain repeat protein [Candidatus Hydrogenedens sp.]